MNAYFNEHSAYPHVPAESALTAMSGFVESCCTILKYGVKKISCDKGPGSIQLSETETMHSYCVKNRRNDKVILLISNFSKPYIKEDSPEEAQFVDYRYAVTVKDDKDEKHEVVNPMGLASADIYDSFVVSLASTTFWKSTKVVDLEVKKIKKVRNAENCVEDHVEICVTRKIRNVSEPSDLNEDLRNHIACKSAHNWVKSDIVPASKTINLSSDHHGNDKLKAFAKNSLRQLDYFIEVSTSLEFSPKFDHFVKAIYTSTKQIDVVLYKNDSGYSMRIKTTAENEIQLRQIALELETKFGTGKPGFSTSIAPSL